jgi:hypothetical protein
MVVIKIKMVVIKIKMGIYQNKKWCAEGAPQNLTNQNKIQ